MRTSFAALAAILAGCASAPPSNPNPGANWDADKWACQQQVAALPAPARPAPRTEVVTQCQRNPFGQEVNCVSSQQRASSGSPQQAMFDTMAELDAANFTKNAMVSCMKAKGWR